jgi:hypothetical protein
MVHWSAFSNGDAGSFTDDGAIPGSDLILPTSPAMFLTTGSWRQAGTGRWSGFIVGGNPYNTGDVVGLTDVRALTISNRSAAFDASPDLRVVVQTDDRGSLVGRFADTHTGFYLRAFVTPRINLAASSDSGAGSSLNGYDGITNFTNAPGRSLTFQMYGAPSGGTMVVDAAPLSGGAPIALGSVTAPNAPSSDILTLTAPEGVVFPEGRYRITAHLVIGGTEFVSGSTDITIDTTAPVITSTPPATSLVVLVYDVQTNDEASGAETVYWATDNNDPTQPGPLQFYVYPDGRVRYWVAGPRVGRPINCTVTASDIAGNSTSQTFDTVINGFVTYYPEGFGGSTISEFLPIVNPNDQAVDFVVNARYERGGSGIAGEGSIPANSRGGITVSILGDFGENAIGRAMVAGSPYALEMISRA